MKNILVVLTGTETDAVTLRTAFLAARLFSSRLDCLYVFPGPVQLASSAAFAQLDSLVNSVALIRAIEKQEAERKEAARAAFVEFRSACGREVRDSANGGHGISASFRERAGSAVEITVSEARFSDLVVLSRANRAGGLSSAEIATVLLSCGRPVLLAPPAAPDALGASIIVGWKDAAEAARAITAAMPLLQKADRVLVLTADEGEKNLAPGIESAAQMASKLRAHGISAEANCVVLGGRHAQDAFMKSARDAGGDLLVMGAYGHSRTRELFFGGFTQHVLESCPLPVLLFH